MTHSITIPMGLQIKTEYSYGFNLLDGIGILTPFSAMDYRSTDYITYNIGNRIEFGSNTNFEIKGTHEVRDTDSTNNKLQFIGAVYW